MPSPIIEAIIDWTFEFHRIDAIQRVANFRSMFEAQMKRTCEEIVAFIPIYKFTISTQTGKSIFLKLSLPNCDPNYVKPHNGSSITHYERCVV